jgi:alanine racemase
MGYIDCSPEALLEYNIQIAVHDKETAQELNSLARAQHKKIKVHVKVDTGLTRLGVLTVDAPEFITALQQLSYLQIEGICTHLADTNNKDLTFTYQQLARFDEFLALLEARNISVPYTHAIPSGALALETKKRYTISRVGTNLYGLWKSCNNQQRALAHNPTYTLKPVLTWRTSIIQLKHVPAGIPIGYACTYITQRPTTVAILPVGYWDGYPRELSNNSQVVVNNHYAPVVGIISMNLMAIDVTGIPDVSKGSIVTLIGDVPGITATDLAQKLGMLNYGLLTTINPSIARFLVD